MTGDWPHTGYDPTWRSFKGSTAFAPHPSSLEAPQQLVWPPIYVPLDTARPAIAPLPAPDMPKAAPVDWPVDDPTASAPAHLHPFVPESVPFVRSPHPTFRPAIPVGDPAPPATYRVPKPIQAPPVRKLEALFPQDDAAAPPRPKRRTRPWAARPVGMVSIVGAVVAAALIFVVVPKLLSSPATLKTMFTAPMLVLRAVGPGVVTNVAVTIGQPVDPSTVLLTLHANPLTDTAVDDLRARLTQARSRQTALDGAGAAATARQKDAAAAEVDQLQKAIASAGGSGTADQPIMAGVRGIVWALDAQSGARLKAGDPLVQLADCGRAFLVMQGAQSTLKAGQTVLIRMPGVRPFHGTIRPSAGTAEPQNTLVVDPTGFNAAAPNACPVGATAEIQPETRS